MFDKHVSCEVELSSTFTIVKVLCDQIGEVTLNACQYVPTMLESQVISVPVSEEPLNPTAPP